VFQFLADALAFFYDVWPSFGGAIILFTLAIMLVLSPLSIKSARSMIAMQRVGPELKKIQAKHKNDREALNREMMAFYQDHGINPFSSCLPVLLQMPVFIVLYQVLSGLTRRIDGDGSNFNPKYLEDDQGALAVALRGTNEMLSFGMDLSRSALWELQNEGIVTSLPYIALVALVVFTSFVQQRQIQGRNTGSAVNPQQQMIGKILPFIFIPISITIPSGVVIYFVVSNAVRIGQQALVTKLDFSPKALAAAEAKREARLAAKGDVVDVESTVTERKGRGGRADAKRDAAQQEALPPASSERAGRSSRSGATSATSNGSGTRPNGAGRTTTSAVTSGRVTPAGSRPRSRKRKRK
jgi:YidC/Oxa1 family membrane protein insertase